MVGGGEGETQYLKSDSNTHIRDPLIHWDALILPQLYRVGTHANEGVHSGAHLHVPNMVHSYRL